MTVGHAAATRNSIADAVLADIDQDAGAGNLVFLTAADAEVATLVLSDPAGTVTGPTLTFSAISDDTSATGGTTTKAKIESNLNTEVINCAVGTSGSDINLSSTTIGAGDTVSMSSLVYNAPV